MKKRTFKLLCITLCLIIVVGMFPAPAFADRYPSIDIDGYGSASTIPEGEIGHLLFKVFPVYKYEYYNVHIYDSNGNLRGSAGGFLSNTSILPREVDISVDTSSLELEPGRYTVKYYMEYYALNEWCSAPITKTCYFEVIPNICHGNHSLFADTIFSESDCDTHGRAIYGCANCDYYEYRELDYAHDYDYDNGVVTAEPTHDSEGTIEYKCRNCDEYIYDVIPALGHTEVTVPGKAATCTEDGLTDGKQCSVCGEVIAEQQVIPAGHREVTVPGTATCTKPGLSDGKKCALCDMIFVEQKEVPALGHSYDNKIDGTCNRCGIHRETTENRTVMHMFRMYDPNSGEHFYTGSEEEKNNLVEAGWKYEGVGFTFSRTTGAPVYRLYDPVTGEHLYTMNEEEKATLMAQGWNLEGIAFNSAYDTEVPQYRLHNPYATRGAYHFTASTVERDDLIAAGWEYQGIGFYSSWK